MGNDEQIGFEIEFDEKTQAWLDWVAPERIESQVQAFLTRTIPDMTSDSPWWKPPMSTRIMEAAKELFGDRAGFFAIENRDSADQFILFLGECYVRRAGYGWMNIPEWGPPLYDDFGPSVRLGDDRISDVSMVSIAKRLFDDGDGPEMIEYNITEAVRRARKTRAVT
ncbi:hypothetical protein ACQPZ2_34650 [Nocardia pseudovaccinii]|uniref:hypothetical protein n=1 Tax=Nocardia pseudovaccinii TaxID=189540 RepID=UPI003D940C4A